ncbi:MAG TPA: TIGR00366 family protein [Thermoanaerobaculia bacterium]|nr:TIGR00366 family protein [Thermoanaerobaculia bacterium]
MTGGRAADLLRTRPSNFRFLTDTIPRSMGVQGPDVPLARLGSRITDLTDRYFPDAFVFALGAVLVVFLFGIALGERPMHLVDAFGQGFWVLVPFTMQMALIIVTGFVVATSAPCSRVIDMLAAFPRTPRGAVAFVALFSMISSLLSWGFSLIFTGLLVRAIVRRIDDVDFRALGGAAYLGLGSVWSLGLSSSPAMMMATRSAIPEALLPVTGVVPLTQTIFLWQSILLAVLLIALSTAIAYFSAPTGTRVRTARSMGVTFQEMAEEHEERAGTPAERLERHPLLTLLIVGLMFAFLGRQIAAKGLTSTLDLNNFNFLFLALGMLLHWRPRPFLRAVAAAVPATAGVLVQFPFYAGIFGLISKTSIQPVLSDLFIRIANQDTFNPILTIYSFILGIFIPSGGGLWVVEAPYVMEAANALRMHRGWTIQTYNAAETLPNLLNPFFMLPLMGILNVRARDLAGYSILQLLFHTPLVLFYCWLMAYTLPYIPPLQ